jgi:hypothetical protein
MRFEAGNRRAERMDAREREPGTRGPTPLEIALVRKLGSKVRLTQADFLDMRGVEVKRTVDPRDASVTLEVVAKARTIDLVRRQDGSYGVDPYGGL